MKKILSINKALSIGEDLRKKGKKIVLAGGCFDILHAGHIAYLLGAKNAGDILFVLLESDKTIKKLKGNNRPINTQTDRALILENLQMVDYIICTPKIESDTDYDKLITALKPAIIATTKGDKGLSHKIRQANLVGAKVMEVTNQITNKSTTKLIEILNEI